MPDKMTPQTYKFQITGYEESHPDVFILGLGTIDEQNRFTGTLKHQDYGRDLSEPAECNAKSGPYCAWTFALGDDYYGGYYTVLVAALPITNITLVQQQEQGAAGKTRAEYEISPPTNDNYTGPRFEYAFISKPVFPYNSLESCPNGAIYGSFKRGATSLHGTIEYPFELTVREVNAYKLIDYQRTKEQLIEKPFNISDYEVKPLSNQGATMSDQLDPATAKNTDTFKSTEQQVKNKVFETEQTVIENIDKLEYYKGYAKGMNGLIEKVQASVSLEIVVSEVQKLTEQYNTLNSMKDYSPSYPNKHENPRFLQGQITGITEGVQTLRGIDITKYIENAPAPQKQALPEYPALTKDEREEHTAFVQTMQKNYPTADIENLNKLCSIASEMSKHTFNNNNSTLSTDRFNTLTDHQELQIKELIKDLPGIKVTLDYEPRGAAIKFDLPQGQINNLGGYAVPEIPSNKLAPKKTNEFASPFINTTTKGQVR
jgi:hypothetical protein